MQAPEVAAEAGGPKVLRFGKATTQSLRALARLLNLEPRNALAIYVIWCVTGRERKAVRKLQHKLLSSQEQLKAAVQVGLDDSAASRYSEFDSKEALSTHLKMLSKREQRNAKATR